MIIPKLSKSYILSKNYAIKEVANLYSITELNEYSRAFILNDPPSIILKKSYGWGLSNQLINTPNVGIRTWLVVDEYLIEPNLKDYKIQNNELSYGFCNKNFTVDLSNVNYDLELLSFYYRLGYQVTLKPGVGYMVIDPIGTKTFVDLTYCNCINYLNDNNCLHLNLAKSYNRQRKYLEQCLMLCPN